MSIMIIVYINYIYMVIYQTTNIQTNQNEI